MIRFSILAVLLALFAQSLFAQSLFAQSTKATLPRTNGKTLSDRNIVLADEVRGKKAILIVTFSRSAGNTAQEWTREIAKKGLMKPDMQLYQVSMLEDVPRLFRGMVISGIRKGVPVEQHGRFVVLLRDEELWKQTVLHTSDDEPYILGLDAQGAVEWRIQGTVERSRMEELAARLK